MAMEIVLDGSVWAPRKVMARLLDTASRGGNVEKGLSALPRFTPREREVLTLLIAGRPNRDIASMLKIDEGTVKAHVGRLMRKVGVDNRIALTMQAVARKLLDDGGSGV
jgi:DNA-binding NarL/FixJ family response regulator